MYGKIVLVVFISCIWVVVSVPLIAVKGYSQSACYLLMNAVALRLRQWGAFNSHFDIRSSLHRLVLRALEAGECLFSAFNKIMQARQFGRVKDKDESAGVLTHGKDF